MEMNTLQASKRIPPELPARNKIAYPELEEIYNLQKPIHTWTINIGESGQLIIQSFIPDNLGGKCRVYYNPTARLVTDRYNQVLHYVKHPDETLIKEFHERLKALPSPDFFTDHLGNIRLAKNDKLIYNAELGRWINEITGKIEEGLPQISKKLLKK